MKSLPFILIPTIMLIAACIVVNASWPYYIIALVAGNVLGLLALFVWVKVKETDTTKKQKFHYNPQENQGKREDQYEISAKIFSWAIVALWAILVWMIIWETAINL